MGRGRIIIRAKASFEEIDSKECIVVTEIPYQVNKSVLIKKTADLVNEKKIEGISDVRDESGKDGMRIVYELKRDAMPSVVLNNLYKHTELQSSFSVNNIALVGGRPQQLNLKEIIHYFVRHRADVVFRRTSFELKKAQEKIHILEGFMKVIATEDTLSRAIEIIRNAKNTQEAKTGLIQEFELSEMQAQAILDLRLARLTGMELDKIRDEYEQIKALIQDLQDILAKKKKKKKKKN